MTESQENNLMEAVASARMEGYEFTEEQIEIARKIILGEMTLEEYYKMVKAG